MPGVSSWNLKQQKKTEPCPLRQEILSSACSTSSISYFVGYGHASPMPTSPSDVWTRTMTHWVVLSVPAPVTYGWLNGSWSRRHSIDVIDVMMGRTENGRKIFLLSSHSLLDQCLNTLGRPQCGCSSTARTACTAVSELHTSCSETAMDHMDEDRHGIVRALMSMRWDSLNQ